MTTEPNQIDDDPQDDLENALGRIAGLAEVMCVAGKDRDNEAFAYLGSQLRQHCEEAHNAFCRAFKMDDYAP
jgi:hypothetical protein